MKLCYVLKLEMDVILQNHTCLSQKYCQIKLKKIYILSISDQLYVCSTWLTTANDEKRLNIFEENL